MNGLNLIDLEEATFMDKLLRREPRENAFVEINNLLACVPILKLDREIVEKSLTKHKITQDKARSRLLNFYFIILQHFLTDTELDSSELDRLNHLKYILFLDDKETSKVHRNLVQPIYKMHVRKVISDGDLSDKDQRHLNAIAERLYISKEFARKLYVNEASQYLHSVLKKSLADRMLSDEEELELKDLSERLRVNLKFSENAQKNLERCRYLWKLYQGELPKTKTIIQKNRKVKTMASVNAVLYQINNSKVPVKYSGYHELTGQRDYGFHSGTFKNDKVINKVIQFVDQGVLHFTTQGLLFRGNDGDKRYLYKNLTGSSFYQNGLVIEQNRGNDRFLKFAGDMEALKLIFDNLMTKSRK